MPVSKQKKQETIEELKELLGRSSAVILANYRGLTAQQLSQLRNKLRPFGSRTLVAKNTLVLKTLEELGLPQPEEMLTGPTALSVVFGELNQPVRTLLDFARDNDMLVVKGGLMGSHVMTVEEVQTLPQLPSQDALRAQALGGVASPVAGFIGALDGVVRGLLYVLNGRAEQMGQPS